jgi:hypothetical protein
VEEDLGPQEALIANIHCKLFLCHLQFSKCTPSVRRAAAWVLQSRALVGYP